MNFGINREIFFEALSHIQGVIEKKGTLPILSNVLIEAKNSKLILTSTDLDIIFIEFEILTFLQSSMKFQIWKLFMNVQPQRQLAFYMI